MPHEVIMPALGMAQDTGLLVTWLKAPGEAVSTGEPLFEVETDKSTMEVEAAADGFLTDVQAQAGAEVPVGQVIALISDTAQSSGTLPAPAEVKREPQVAAPSPAPAPEVPQTPSMAIASPSIAAAHTPTRVLASPKARRLALEGGLDLARLAAAGHPQPYHAADIEVLRHLPEAGRNAPVKAAAQSQITAGVPRAASEAFCNWMREEGGIDISPIALWASFAAGALRAACPEQGDIAIALMGLEGQSTTLLNPDRSRLRNQIESPDSPATLILRDLSQSHITGLRLGVQDTPVLSIACDGDMLRLGLEFTSAQLADDVAIAFVSGFAERLAEPLTQLL